MTGYNKDVMVTRRVVMLILTSVVGVGIAYLRVRNQTERGLPLIESIQLTVTPTVDKFDFSPRTFTLAEVFFKRKRLGCDLVCRKSYNRNLNWGRDAGAVSQCADVATS